MQVENVAILKSLVSVAWSDGDFGDAEKEMIDALLVAFDADETESSEIRAYAAQKRGLEDIPLDQLTNDDLRVLVQHAVLLTFIDGTQNAKEREFVERMAHYIGLSHEESTHLIASAEARAKRNLRLL